MGRISHARTNPGKQRANYYDARNAATMGTARNVRKCHFCGYVTNGVRVPDPVKGWAVERDACGWCLDRLTGRMETKG